MLDTNNLTNTNPMQKRQSANLRFPYEAPEAEQLFLRLEEQFMNTTFNSDNNENPNLDGELDP